MALGAGLVLIAVGVSLIAVWWAIRVGRLGRNRLAGIRTKAVMASDEAWRAAHDAGGWSIGLAGAATVVVGIGLALVQPSPGRTSLLVNAYAVALFVLVVIGGMQGDRAARRVGQG